MELSTTIWLSSYILKDMFIEADRHTPYETGGVFMGYQANNMDLVVTDLIPAGPNAKHRRFSFEPDHEYQIDQIASIYKKSRGDIMYLGDWHTHPNSSPQLSRIDKCTLTRIALTKGSHNSHPIMTILGGKTERWIINTVQFESGQLRPWLISKCSYRYIQHKYYA
jgi:integrative and conjugative element protein (TIGR02256 family)